MFMIAIHAICSTVDGTGQACKRGLLKWNFTTTTTITHLLLLTTQNFFVIIPSPLLFITLLQH